MLVKKLNLTLALTLILTQSLTPPTLLDLPQKLQYALAFLRKNEIATIDLFTDTAAILN